MRKLIFLFIICLLLLPTLIVKGQKKNDWTEENLRGKVKSKNEVQYRAIDSAGEIYKGQISSRLFTLYDTNGNKTEEIFYGTDDILKFNSTYKYDNNRNLIERRYHYYPDSTQDHKLTFKYNEKGYNIEYNYTKFSNLNNKTTFKFDSKGKQIESNEYDSEGRLNRRLFYKYNDKGNLEELNFYDLEIIRNQDTEYTYDSFEGRQTFKYDSKGNKIQENYYYSDNKLHYQNNYKYDNNGNEILINVCKQFDKSPSYTWSSKYTFDKKENWTQRMMYFKGKLGWIVLRQIEYY